MKGSSWAQTLPNGRSGASLAERNRAIVNAVREGLAIHQWSLLEVLDEQNHLLLQVSRAPLRIGESTDAVWVSVSESAQSQIASILGAELLTPRLSDIMWLHSDLKAPPVTRAWYSDGSMAWTSRMLEQSAALDAIVGQDPGATLVSNLGKDWVKLRTIAAGRAANYGWYVKSGGEAAVTSGLRVLQGVGTAHNPDHVDYSQLARFVSRDVILNGKPVSFSDVLAMPAASKLVAHDGPFGGGGSASGGGGGGGAPVIRSSLSHTARPGSNAFPVGSLLLGSVGAVITLAKR